MALAVRTQEEQPLVPIDLPKTRMRSRVQPESIFGGGGVVDRHLPLGTESVENGSLVCKPLRWNQRGRCIHLPACPADDAHGDNLIDPKSLLRNRPFGRDQQLCLEQTD